jgi:hypothetical protein
LLLQGTATSPTPGANNLASPVSTDGDEEEQARGGSKTGHTSGPPRNVSTSTVGSNARISNASSSNQQIESRSPESTVEYGQQRESSISPAASFGFSVPRYESLLLPVGDLSSSHRLQQPETSALTAFTRAGSFPQLSASAIGVSEGTFYPTNRAHPQHYNRHSFKDPSLMIPSVKSMQQQHPHSYEEMAREMERMREQLKEKDMVVSSLQHRVNYLENQINELRQLPTGKISHIPVE